MIVQQVGNPATLSGDLPRQFFVSKCYWLGLFCELLTRRIIWLPLSNFTFLPVDVIRLPLAELEAFDVSCKSFNPITPVVPEFSDPVTPAVALLPTRVVLRVVASTVEAAVPATSGVAFATPPTVLVAPPATEPTAPVVPPRRPPPPAELTPELCGALGYESSFIVDAAAAIGAANA
jgi:hypothetical protein